MCIRDSPEAEAVRALALSGGELAALGLEGPAIGAAQRRLAAHILSHPCLLYTSRCV